MPKSIGGLFAWIVSTLVMTAVGVAILSRTPIWPRIVGGPR